MRIVAFVTEPAVVRRILAHLARRGIEARASPHSWRLPLLAYKPTPPRRLRRSGVDLSRVL